MRISHQLVQCSMPTHELHLWHCQAPLKKSADRLMTQVMEPQIMHLQLPRKLSECLL